MPKKIWYIDLITKKQLKMFSLYRLFYQTSAYSFILRSIWFIWDSRKIPDKQKYPIRFRFLFFLTKTIKFWYQSILVRSRISACVLHKENNFLFDTKFLCFFFFRIMITVTVSNQLRLKVNSPFWRNLTQLRKQKIKLIIS